MTGQVWGGGRVYRDRPSLPTATSRAEERQQGIALWSAGLRSADSFLQYSM